MLTFSWGGSCRARLFGCLASPHSVAWPYFAFSVFPVAVRLGVASFLLLCRLVSMSALQLMTLLESCFLAAVHPKPFGRVNTNPTTKLLYSLSGLQFSIWLSCSANRESVHLEGDGVHKRSRSTVRLQITKHAQLFRWGLKSRITRGHRRMHRPARGCGALTLCAGGCSKRTCRTRS